MAWSSLRHRTVPATAAAGLLGACAFVAFAVAPAAVAQVADLARPTPAAGGADGSIGGIDAPVDGLLDGLGFPGGLVAGVALTLGVIFVTLAFLGGTKFVNSENVLENDARRSIFEFIKEHPGTHLRATAAALDLSTTNVLWHLRKLEGANLVASRKFEGYKVFYPAEGGVESRRRALALAVLRNGNARDILEHVLGTPSAHQREIARFLGVNHGTIRWHLRKLTESGLLFQVKTEQHASYFVSELGLQILREMGSSRAEAHASGAERAPGAAVPASIALPVPAVEGARPSPPAHTAAPAYGPDVEN